MSTLLRLATFNLENLDDKPGQLPSLADRIAVLRPQLVRLRADILCLQEVNAQEPAGQPRQLYALKTLIQDTPYSNYAMAHTVTTAGQPYDERNLVILSRFPFSAPPQQFHNDLIPMPKYRALTQIPATEEAKDVSWERPLVYARMDIGSNRILHLINVHLKSKIPSTILGQKIDEYTWKSVSGWAEGYFLSSMKRVGQALEARRLVDKIFDEQSAGEFPLIAVCGDFNADSDDVPVTAIRGPVEETGNPQLLARIMIPCELSIPESARYTLLHLGKGNMIDHILVTRTLLMHYRSAEIHNEILPDESGAFRTDVKFPESDHAPLIAEFALP